MNAYALPTSLNIGGVDFLIRTDFRAILDILEAMQDEELDDRSKLEVELTILFESWWNIPKEHIQEALEKAAEFIDAGIKEERKRPKIINWKEDAEIIVPAVNKAAGREIRELEYMHWWTFLAYYMEIGESTFASVVSIRKKRAEGKKLEKYELEFMKENPQFFRKKSERDKEEKNALKELWG